MSRRRQSYTPYRSTLDYERILYGPPRRTRRHLRLVVPPPPEEPDEDLGAPGLWIAALAVAEATALAGAALVAAWAWLLGGAA